MVNRYFGGQLSQDRIAYEVFRGRQSGPEQDLSYAGSGFNVAQVTQGLTFALGAAPLHGQVSAATQATFWNVLRQEIDAGRPIIVGAARANGQGHATVLVAYRDLPGDPRISLADPWAPGSAAGVITQVKLTRFIASHAAVHIWVMQGAPQPASDEPEMSMDSDQDGIVDFDETRRFGTSAFDPDTDGDFVGDFLDVRASVFDRQFGYSLGGNPTRVDVDGDGGQMELDADSDGDRCTDGQEDFTLNGDFEPALHETHNFDELDKRCRAWIGRTTFDMRFTATPFTHIRATGRIRWVPEPPLVPGPPLPGFTSSFVPEGDASLDSFSVLGCRFLANPNHVTVDATAGRMDIDYLSTTPGTANGGAGTALITTLTNCQGQSFPEVIPLIVLFSGPVQLNAAEDEIKSVQQTTTQTSVTTVDIEYHLESP
jgi:hypothetical protein